MLEKINGKGISLATLVMVLGLFAQQVRWQTKMEARMESVEKHATDNEKHPSYRENSVLFVPRFEIQSKLDNIQSAIEKIDKKLDRK